MLKAPIQGGDWGMEFLESLTLAQQFCKEAGSNPGPPGHKREDSTTAPGTPCILDKMHLLIDSPCCTYFMQRYSEPLIRDGCPPPAMLCGGQLLLLIFPSTPLMLQQLYLRSAN